MTTALFAGSFDPPSLGHLDIIQRASQLYTKLYVGVAINKNKAKGLLSAFEKVELLKKITDSLPNVEVVSFEGLVVDFAKKNNVSVLIRGLRPFQNFEHEYSMARANKNMSGIETVFLLANEESAYISSSLIREIAGFGKRLHGLVPVQIETEIYLKVNQLIANKHDQ